MKNWVPLIFFLLTFCASCHKKDTGATCAVTFNLNSTLTYPLVGTTWTFVGFLDTSTNTIASPLCGNILSNIIFTDSSISTLTVPLPPPDNSYPLHYYGSALINGYDGSYMLKDSTHLLLSQTADTKINGNDDVNKFEQRFHSVLQQVSRFRILYNEFTLYPDTGSTVMRFKAD